MDTDGPDPAPATPGTTGTCQSCGRDGEELAEVRRVYLTLDRGQVVGEQEADEVERWCAACRAQYPHQPA